MSVRSKTNPPIREKGDKTQLVNVQSKFPKEKELKTAKKDYVNILADESFIAELKKDDFISNYEKEKEKGKKANNLSNLYIDLPEIKEEKYAN